MLLVPILMPLTTELGIDPIHFGLMVTVSLAIGQQTPPVASVPITTCSIVKVPLGEVMRVNIFFILAMFVVLMLVTFFPALSLWLPSVVALRRRSCDVVARRQARLTEPRSGS